VSAPRIVLSGECWRVVALERPDANGVLRTDYVIDVTDHRDVDSLGVQRWHTLTGKSAMHEWVTIARRFLDVLLKQAGEEPDDDSIRPF
jgi:hypothetical protein